MARIRSIKPGFFRNEDLGELSPWHRLAFAGLWCEADKAGRLEDRPKRLKANIFPYDDVDLEAILRDLVAAGFVRRYVVDGQACLQVVHWTEHQRPRDDEPESRLPPPPGDGDAPPSRDSDESVTPKTRPRPVAVNGASLGSALGSGILGTESTHTPRAREAAAPPEAERAQGDHRAHVACGAACVPRFLHEEFVAAVGDRAAPQSADAWLLDRYAEDLAALAAGTLERDQAPVAWWRARCYDVWLGGRGQGRGRQPPRNRAPAAGGISCPHHPPCATVSACITRTLAEGREQGSGHVTMREAVAS